MNTGCINLSAIRINSSKETKLNDLIHITCSTIFEYANEQRVIEGVGNVAMVTTNGMDSNLTDYDESTEP